MLRIYNNCVLRLLLSTNDQNCSDLGFVKQEACFRQIEIASHNLLPFQLAFMLILEINSDNMIANQTSNLQLTFSMSKH